MPIPELEENGMPPRKKIAAALVAVTETLACALTDPLTPLPIWSDFQWRIARAVAAMQGIASQLLTGLPWTGPASWHDFLAEQTNHVAHRHHDIVRLMQQLDSLARRDGIAIIALKGMALHSVGIYLAGERPMADVDLLVRDADLNAVTALLKECGYEFTFATWRHCLFERQNHCGAIQAAWLGEHANNPIKIEVHTRILERLPRSVTDITTFVLPRCPKPGVNSYSSRASMMMHLLLHAAGNVRSHSLRLIQLHDIACVARRMTASDWTELTSARDSQRLWWAFVPLVLTARYFTGAIPTNILQLFEDDCPWLLRKLVRNQRLADVSWANLKIYAFPGIEWSQSFREAADFMFSRILPSKRTRAELNRIATNHPGAKNISWYGISQNARILRWLFSSPPRVQPLIQVYTALQTKEHSPFGAKKK